MQSLRRLASTQYRRFSLWHWSDRKLHRDIQEVADRFGNGLLLDVGCGSRPFMQEFRSRVTRHIGVDTVSGVHGWNPDLDVAADAATLPFASGSFDTILCTQVLEHVEYPMAVLTEISRVLKGGGCVIASAPLMNVVHEPPHDYYRFTPYALRSMMEDAKLEVHLIKPQGGGWAMLGQNVAWRVSGFAVGGGRLRGTASLLLANALALPFFLLERLDQRAAFHEAINYLVVGQKPVR
jgi:SAM-dependent methyltransferase